MCLGGGEGAVCKAESSRTDSRKNNVDTMFGSGYVQTTNELEILTRRVTFSGYRDHPIKGVSANDTLESVLF